MSIRDRLPWLMALRPHQWTKNGVVFAALIFAFGDQAIETGWPEILESITALALFCGLSSSIYLLNDIQDVELDRAHPKKRHRPIAAGKVPIPAARILSVTLMIITLGCGFLLQPQLGIVLSTYFVMQLAYTYGLKKIALLDIFIIATGFVLRALAGAVAIQAPISPWLLLCTMLLALFLALCKRRHEKAESETGGDTGNFTRPSLEKYNTQLLDQLISVVCASIITSYALYTLWPETIEKFGTNRLGFTIPIVIFGLFRYLDLVYRHDQGDRPERILLTDIPLLCTLALYGTTVLTILLTKNFF